ncbi:MAG: sulfotransferase [bacterium]|nr:sulfotransferase [bacterium]
MSDLESRPVIIVGAARSGTNMLRDALTSLPGFTTWPCDEIPFVWRHGNRAHPDDEFPPDLATEPVRRFVRWAFARQGRSDSLLVEKTCANSLRLGFVDRVLPEARFLVIERDGPDAVASAMKRWRAGFDLGYSLAKARFVPPSDLPYYGFRFLANRLRRLTTRDRRLSVWGPIFAGMRDLPRDILLAELAARQWHRCVERTRTDLSQVDPARVLRLRYEEFVADPAVQLAGAAEFLGAAPPAAAVAAAVAGVRTTSVGKGRQSLAPGELDLVEDLAASFTPEVRS